MPTTTSDASHLISCFHHQAVPFGLPVGSALLTPFVAAYENQLRLAQLRVSIDSSIQYMKPHRSKFISSVLLTVALILLTFAPSSDARHDRWVGWGGGRLIIKRSPDLGNLAWVDVKIDGATAGGILWAQSYDAPLPTGRHVIQIRLAPTYYTYSPSSLIVDVQPGQTYSFMAMKRGGALVLARDGYLLR